jgi:hypothetical protein
VGLGVKSGTGRTVATKPSRCHAPSEVKTTVIAPPLDRIGGGRSPSTPSSVAISGDDESVPS